MSDQNMDNEKLPDLGVDDSQTEIAQAKNHGLEDAAYYPTDSSHDYDQGDMETQVGSDHEHDEIRYLPGNIVEPELYSGIDIEHTDRPDESPPPPYEEYATGAEFGPLVNSSIDAEPIHTVREPSTINTAQETNNADDKEAFEFPESNLFELEGRCFVDSWSIPYKKNESLGILLHASAKLAAQGPLVYLLL